MSSLSSVFNSCSTLIAWDVYGKLHPGASDRMLVRAGQIATVVLVGTSLAWIPMMGVISGEIFQYLQSVQAYISPPVAAVFLGGVFWKRINSAGAMTSLLLGFALGASRLVAELWKESLPDGWILAYADINFLHFAGLLFLVCAVVLVSVSLLTPPPQAERIRGLTFGTPIAQASGSAPHQAKSDAVWRRHDLGISILVAGGVALTWLFFTG
jgi:SSS family solute:Na+ symporter